jgi:hypothetical protein
MTTPYMDELDVCPQPDWFAGVAPHLYREVMATLGIDPDRILGEIDAHHVADVSAVAPSADSVRADGLVRPYVGRAQVVAHDGQSAA